MSLRFYFTFQNELGFWFKILLSHKREIYLHRKSNESIIRQCLWIFNIWILVSEACYFRCPYNIICIHAQKKRKLAVGWKYLCGWHKFLKLFSWNYLVLQVQLSFSSNAKRRGTMWSVVGDNGTFGESYDSFYMSTKNM